MREDRPSDRAREYIGEQILGLGSTGAARAPTGGRGRRGTFDSPKSKYGRRDIPLSQRLAHELELRFMFEEDVDRLVFPSATGTVLDASNLMARVLKPAARRAGVPWASFHTFRHSCATRLFRRGVNPVQVQMWLGHHSPAFTQAVYVHLLASDLPDGDVLEAPAGGNGTAPGPTETSRDGEAPKGAENGSGSRSVSSDLAASSFF